jgi:hypothetical protein
MYLETFKVEKEFDYITSSGKKSKRKRISTHVKLQCNNCNSIFTKEAHDLNPKRRNNNYEHFCGKCGDVYSLATKSYNKKNPNKHDHLLGTKITDSHGYTQLYVSNNYKYKTKETSSVYGGRIREHIHVMQEHIDRPLKKGEVVHHIDGDKSNNNISNLDLCTVQGHNNCHAKIEKIVFELYKKGVVRYDRINKFYYLV